MATRSRVVSASLLTLTLILIAGYGGAAFAQDTTYVLIPGIPGESTDPAHQSWIQAYGLNTASLSSGGGTPTHDDVYVLKGTDSSTPVLHQRLSGATNLGTVLIEVCRNPAGGGQECYYKLNLENALVTGVSLSGSSCIDPSTSCTPSQTESVGFSYTRITWRYVSFSKAQSTCGCWDLAAGKSCSCTP